MDETVMGKMPAALYLLNIVFFCHKSWLGFACQGSSDKTTLERAQLAAAMLNISAFQMILKRFWRVRRTQIDGFFNASLRSFNISARL